VLIDATLSQSIDGAPGVLCGFRVAAFLDFFRRLSLLIRFNAAGRRGVFAAHH